MRTGRLFVASGAMVLGLLLLPAPAARAELTATEVLSSPAVKQAERVGVIVVGTDGSEATAARALVRKTLEAARFRVTQLPISLSAPPRALLLTHCASRDLDAVALVRISTAAAGWKVDVELREPHGTPIIVKLTDDGGPFPRDRRPVYAGFSLAMTAADVAAAAHQGEDAVTALDADPTPDQPRLWVSEKATLLGGVRINGADFYRLVGRDDLLERYRNNSRTIAITRGFGYASLGIGTTTLVLAALVAAAAEGICVVPNAYDSLQNQPKSCDDGVGSLFLVPLTFGLAGGGLLAASAAMSRDPISLQEKRALAREYNERNASPPAAPPRAAGTRSGPRISLSGAPLAKGDGGIVLLGGRF